MPKRLEKKVKIKSLTQTLNNILKDKEHFP